MLNENDGKSTIKVENLCKEFGKTKVLKDVNFDIVPGEVHALMGENGAGKSTLMNVIFGVHRITSGKIFVDGDEVRISSPTDARKYGMAMIHQEPLTFQNLSILENIFAGNMEHAAVNYRTLEKKGQEIMDSLGISFDIHRKVMGLSVADMQKIEIANVLASNARVIFMDEPTASLTPHEVNKLLDLIRSLTKQGKSVVYVSHRLNEVMEIADRVTVLRNGSCIGTYQRSDLTENKLVRLMIGKSLGEFITKETVPIEEKPYFEVQDISVKGCFSNVSFKVHRGEIFGLAGLVGAGRSEIARGIFGITPVESGKILIDGKEVKIKNPKQAIANKIALLPEDRQGLGLLLEKSIAFNSTFAVPHKITNKWGVVSRKAEQELTSAYAKLLQTKCDSYEQRVNELSGGNQQKVSIAKWLSVEPDILILDEPTRGIDIGAKTEVYKLISQLAREGKCIILISSEQAEIIGLCDNVVVMYEGRMSGTLRREELQEEKVLMAAHNRKG